MKKVRTKYGFPIYIYDKEMDRFAYEDLTQKKVWEKNLTKLYVEALTRFKEDILVIDAGAYIGWYSLVAASLELSNTRIYAFEPFQETYEMLTLNTIENGFKNIVPMKYALGDKIQEGTIYPNVGENRGDSRMYNHSAVDYINREPVAVINLDEIFFKKRFLEDYKHLVMKVDVQGSELLVLKGAKNLINRFGSDVFLLVEYFPAGIRSMGRREEEFKTLLDELKLHVDKTFIFDQPSPQSFYDIVLVSDQQIELIIKKR